MSTNSNVGLLLKRLKIFVDIKPVKKLMLKLGILYMAPFNMS